MKKIISLLNCLLFALIILFPVGAFLSACFGYTFELISVPAFSIAIASLSVLGVILNLVFKISVENKVVSVLSAFLTPLSLINAVVYVFICPKILVFACVFVSVGCCCFLTIKHGKTRGLKITSLVLSAILVIPICYISLIVLVVSGIGQNTVIKSVESPSGTYYAEVIDSNQGALGGDTLVDVYEKRGIDMFIFKISKMPQRVYVGRWGEFEDMQIDWKSDSCLVINSVEYEIE